MEPIYSPQDCFWWVFNDIQQWEKNNTNPNRSIFMRGHACLYISLLVKCSSLGYGFEKVLFFFPFYRNKVHFELRQFVFFFKRKGCI